MKPILGELLRVRAQPDALRLEVDLTRAQCLLVAKQTLHHRRVRRFCQEMPEEDEP